MDPGGGAMETLSPELCKEIAQNLDCATFVALAQTSKRFRDVCDGAAASSVVRRELGEDCQESDEDALTVIRRAVYELSACNTCTGNTTTVAYEDVASVDGARRRAEEAGALACQWAQLGYNVLLRQALNDLRDCVWIINGNTPDDITESMMMYLKEIMSQRRIFEVISNNYHRCLRLLMPAIPVGKFHDIRSGWCRVPLHHAAYAGKVECVRAVLWDLDERDDEDVMLIESTICSWDEDGATVFHTAARYPEIFCVIVDHFIQRRSRRHDERETHITLAECLLRSAEHGFMVAHEAIICRAVKSLEKITEVVNLMTDGDREMRAEAIDCKMEDNSHDRGVAGTTPLLLASCPSGSSFMKYITAKFYPDAVRVLLKCGACLMNRNKNGHTPLMMLIVNRSATREFLLEAMKLYYDAASDEKRKWIREAFVPFEIRSACQAAKFLVSQPQAVLRAVTDERVEEVEWAGRHLEEYFTSASS